MSRATVSGLVGAAVQPARSRLQSFENLLLTQRLAIYGVALSRILAGTAYIGILLSNFSARHLLFGVGSGWAGPYRDHSEQSDWIGLFAHLPAPVFTLCYLGVIVLGILFVLGWHTRVVGVLFVVGCVQILELNPLVSDQGDNVLRIGICLILLTDCAAFWSLDAARAARIANAENAENAGPGREGSRPAVRGALGALSDLGAHPMARTARTILHNAAVITLGMQLVIIYISAAMFKIPGVGWREGTAIAYPLRSDAYQVWPLLNDLATKSGIVVWLVTYGALFLQLYFPALLLNRVTRRLALVAIVGLHLGIAILMGLPWFTLAMVAFDGIFISTATYQLVGRWWVPHWHAVRVACGRRLLRTPPGSPVRVRS